MAFPTSYTEEEFQTYLDTVIGATADVLGWSVVGGQYVEPTYAAMFAYGTDDITSVTGIDNLQKLRTLGRVEVWRAVIGEVSADYDWKADGGDYKRSQIFDHAKKMFDAAVGEALPYDSNYAVEVGTFEEYDPYQRLTLTEYQEATAIE